MNVAVCSDRQRPTATVHGAFARGATDASRLKQGRRGRPVAPPITGPRAFPTRLFDPSSPSKQRNPTLAPALVPSVLVPSFVHPRESRKKKRKRKTCRKFIPRSLLVQSAIASFVAILDRRPCFSFSCFLPIIAVLNCRMESDVAIPVAVSLSARHCHPHGEGEEEGGSEPHS